MISVLKPILVSVSLLALVACSSGDDNATETTFIVDNQTPFEVYGVWVSLSSAGEWGEDRLGNDTLPSGESMSFSLSECDTEYDMVASPLNPPDPNSIINAFGFDQTIECGSEFTFTVTE